MAKNHWEIASQGSLRVGGRPSKVKRVLSMNLESFFEGAGDGAFSSRTAAKALNSWLEENKESGDDSVSFETCRRVIRCLTTGGRLVKDGRLLNGKSDKIRILPKPAGL